MRLDIYLHKTNPNLSRAVLQRLIKEGKVTVNGSVQLKNSFDINENDTVELQIDPVNIESLQQIELEVLYEDDDCVVISKPQGILTHSKGTFNPEPTVASWLSNRSGFEFTEEATDENPRKGIVHRLDRATSGVMICAKNEKSLKHLQKQFQDKKAKKTYIARVEGEVKPPEAMINLPIERNPKEPQRFRVGQNGKSAQTKYKQVKSIETAPGRIDSILELNPLTGRTHQLRVHLNYIKHPIVGDTFYKGRPADRLYLHARKLEITLPNKQRETFAVDVPPEFYENRI